MAIRFLAASERRAVPWKNGGGVTREIAAAPEGAAIDAFDWRVSMAEVAAAGPFSRFEGVDRILTVLNGELELSFPGEPPETFTATLTPGSEPFAFPGDRDYAGAPRGGAVTDLNVMVRRGSMRAEVRRVGGEAPLTVRGAALLVVALEAGRLGGLRLEPFDALLADGGETLTPDGPLRLLVIDLYRA
jgi:environmental stress-induced protein Ves